MDSGGGSTPARPADASRPGGRRGPCWPHGRRRPDDHRAPSARLVPHDPRRAAAAGARGRRLGGRLPGRHRAAPVGPRRGAGRGPLVAAAPPARAPRAVRRGPRRPRPGGGARHHPLAAPGVPRLLPGQHVGAGHPRRHRVERPRHPGDAVADRPGLHRGRDATCSTGWSSCSACPSGSGRRGAGGGVIQDSASSATLCALLAARERAVRAGADLDRLVVYASTQAHSSLEKGARVAGLGADQVRLIDVDDDARAATRTCWPPRSTRTWRPGGCRAS